ncbi:glutathione S-transferase family protein [Parahaliea aestuarii]|uniref:Glutathione S-transferase family protein n=1 Tax=Parahaliea aestuarii TaxID=1852021 RepID=A0A5C9A247_9GAMM|nr:glutathione S-transferase family protein [Parahaliea aestuarii]TXS93421.1 glutathione S-transferase family protein [Parahaliea aestuarii]
MAAIKLVIGNRNYSSWSLRAWLCLRKSGAAFTEELLPLDTPEFARRIGDLSPSRTVPVLWHGERCVWDSLAICEYINETFADGQLWPRDAGLRALGRSLVAEMHSGYGALRAAMPMNFRARQRRVPTSPALEADIARIFQRWTLARQQGAGEGPWLLGTFSIADAFFAPVAVRFGGYGVALPAGPVADYVAHLRADEAMQEWERGAAAESWIVEADEAGEETAAPE